MQHTQVLFCEGWIVQRPIENWIVLISGFTQRIGDSTGTRDLWRKVRRLSDDTTCVMIQPWNADWRQVAELIWDESRRCGGYPRHARIGLAAYSWGAGYGFVQLAKQLRRRGMVVARAVLCDPVYCHPSWLLRAFAAINPLRQIVVPDNVHHVEWLRQETSRLRGHDVLPACESLTVVSNPHLIQCDHVHADEDTTFHRLAGQMAKAIRGKSKD